MKKRIAVLILAICFAFFFSGCAIDTFSELPQEVLLSYENDIYYSKVSEIFTFNDYLIMLSEPDIDDYAYICTSDKVNRNIRNKVSIKRFSDPTLEAFITHKDFWGEWIYCKKGIAIPDIYSCNISEFVLKPMSNDMEWDEYYKGKQYEKLPYSDGENLINQLYELESDSSKYKQLDFQRDKIISTKTLSLKLADINALYFVGTIYELENGRIAFYNPHSTDNITYIL